MKLRRVLGAVVLLLAVSLGMPRRVAADSLQLHDGRHFDGHYVGGTESVVAFLTQGTVQYFPVGDVMLVVFGNAGSAVSPLGLDGSSLAPMSGKQPAAKSEASPGTGNQKAHPEPKLSPTSAQL